MYFVSLEGLTPRMTPRIQGRQITLSLDSDSLQKYIAGNNSSSYHVSVDGTPASSGERIRIGDLTLDHAVSNADGSIDWYIYKNHQ